MLIKNEDILKMEKRGRAAMINKLNGYKSPVLLGTQNKEQQTNLTLISSFTHIGSDPALLAFIFRPGTVERHGFENILETGIFTVNFLNEKMVKRAHQTSARYDRDVSEFEVANFMPEFMENFEAPFVQESPLKIAMRFREKIDLTINGTHMIIAEIIFIKALKDHEDLSELSSVAVNGLDTYYTTKKLVKLSYAKPDLPLTEL